jgi:hypothetical protein
MQDDNHAADAALLRRAGAKHYLLAQQSTRARQMR